MLNVPRAFHQVDTDEGIERLVLAWPDAPTENTEVLALILGVAEEQVMEYADAEYSVPGMPLPKRLIYAQLQQAINLWNAGRAGVTGEVGPEGYSFTPRPLDKTIRSIIRPTRGAADVF